MTDHAGHVMVNKDALPRGKLMDALPQRDNSANWLVYGIERSARLHLPLHHIRCANATRLELEEQFPWPDLRHGQINETNIIIGIIHNSTHRSTCPYRLAGTTQRKPNGSAPSAK